jgi:hypothetical protein
MSIARVPLNATISAISLELGGQNLLVPISVPNYRGRPLFLRAGSDGTTLTLGISDIPGPDPETPAHMATKADITITHKDVTVRQTVNGITFNPPQPLELKMKVNSNLKDAVLVVREAESEAVTDIDLTFVLVESANPTEPRLKLEWIKNPISISNAAKLSSALVVPQDQAPGSTVGPMGFAAE